MIIYGRLTHVFIVDSWEIVKRVEDSDFKNIDKYFMTTMPGFDEETFPFILLSGESSINILNVNDGSMEPLIAAASNPKRAQTAFFFIKRTNALVDSIEMHFSTTRTSDDALTLQNWNVMRL